MLLRTELKEGKQFDYLNTRLVQYADPTCSYKLIFYESKPDFGAWLARPPKGEDIQATRPVQSNLARLEGRRSADLYAEDR